MTNQPALFLFDFACTVLSASIRAEKMREAKFDVNDEILRPYFPLPQVMEGLFELVNKLFGIQVEAADGLTPVWNKDVRFFKISKNGKPQVSQVPVLSTQSDFAIVFACLE